MTDVANCFEMIIILQQVNKAQTVCYLFIYCDTTLGAKQQFFLLFCDFYLPFAALSVFLEAAVSVFGFLTFSESSPANVQQK